MENLPALDQASASSPSNAKQLKNSKWLFIVLGVVILVLIGEGIYWLKLKNKQYSPFKYNVYGNDLSAVDSAWSSGVAFVHFLLLRAVSFMDFGKSIGCKYIPDTAIFDAYP